jgi:hypothetical protein
MVDVKEKRNRDLAEARARYKGKKIKEGKVQTQIWLSDVDKQNIETLKEKTGLKTNSQVVSHALSVTVSLESDAQDPEHSDK